MNLCIVLTAWNAQRQPTIAIDYFGFLEAVNDITGQDQASISPDPNQYAVEIVCDDATLTLIESDASYYVLSSEVIDEAI